MKNGFKSKAEKRKYGQLVAAGKVSAESFRKRASETPARIPERVHPTKIKTVKVIK